MKLAIMQPTFLPWLGYFELMARADHFVLFDNVQFAKKTWQNRNRIKVNTGELFLVVPVKTSGARFQNINEVQIDNTQDWARKHLRTIEVNYIHAPFFKQYIEPVREIYQSKPLALLDLNMALIRFLANQFGIGTQISLASSIETRSERDDRIIDLCHHFHTDILYDAEGARGLLDHAKYLAAGITLKFQEYRHPVFAQLHGPFVPYLSALDLLFNEGPRSLEVILSGAAT